MVFRKIAGPLTIESKADNSIVEFPLDPMAGGHTVKVTGYMLKVIWASDLANCKVGVKLNHGPDGNVSTNHSIPRTPVVPDTVPGVVAGDSDMGKVLSEFLHPIITIQGPNGGPAQKATVELFEMRKPF